VSSRQYDRKNEHSRALGNDIGKRPRITGNPADAERPRRARKARSISGRRRQFKRRRSGLKKKISGTKKREGGRHARKGAGDPSSSSSAKRQMYGISKDGKKN